MQKKRGIYVNESASTTKQLTSPEHSERFPRRLPLLSSEAFQNFWLFRLHVVLCLLLEGIAPLWSQFSRVFGALPPIDSYLPHLGLGNSQMMQENNQAARGVQTARAAPALFRTVTDFVRNMASRCDPCRPIIIIVLWFGVRSALGLSTTRRNRYECSSFCFCFVPLFVCLYVPRHRHGELHSGTCSFLSHIFSVLASEAYFSGPGF